MSEELAAVEESIEPVEVEQVEETTEAVEGEAPLAKPEDPPGYKKAIDNQHKKYRNEERRANALERELEELKATIPKAVRPDIPEIPDQFDDDFAGKMLVRDKAIQEAQAFDTSSRLQQEADDATLRQQQDQERQVVQKRAQVFTERATTAGISENEVTTSIQTISAYGGVGAELANHIMDGEQGPAVVSHLAKNPDQVIALQGMSPMQGAVYISTKLIPSLSTNPSAPPPVDSLGNSGAPPAQTLGPKGTTYK